VLQGFPLLQYPIQGRRTAEISPFLSKLCYNLFCSLILEALVIGGIVESLLLLKRETARYMPSAALATIRLPESSPVLDGLRRNADPPAGSTL